MPAATPPATGHAVGECEAASKRRAGGLTSLSIGGLQYEFQYCWRGSAFEEFGSAIIDFGFGGDIIETTDMDGLVQLMEEIGISGTPQLMLKSVFASWKTKPEAAFEALAAVNAKEKQVSSCKSLGFALSTLHSRQVPYARRASLSRLSYFCFAAGRYSAH